MLTCYRKNRRWRRRGLTWKTENSWEAAGRDIWILRCLVLSQMFSPMEVLVAITGIHKPFVGPLLVCCAIYFFHLPWENGPVRHYCEGERNGGIKEKSLSKIEQGEYWNPDLGLGVPGPVLFP